MPFRSHPGAAESSLIERIAQRTRQEDEFPERMVLQHGRHRRFGHTFRAMADLGKIEIINIGRRELTEKNHRDRSLQNLFDRLPGKMHTVNQNAVRILKIDDLPKFFQQLF